MRTKRADQGNAANGYTPTAVIHKVGSKGGFTLVIYTSEKDWGLCAAAKVVAEGKIHGKARGALLRLAARFEESRTDGQTSANLDDDRCGNPYFYLEGGDHHDQRNNQLAAIVAAAKAEGWSF